MSSKMSAHTSRIKRIPRLGLLAAVAIVLGLSVVLIQMKLSATEPTAGRDGPVSRQVLLASETEIKSLRPGPTIGALDYAYVASVYSGVLAVSNQSEAVSAAQTMMKTLFPTQTVSVDASIAHVISLNHLKTVGSVSQLSASAGRVLSSFQKRYETDKHDLVWGGAYPTGPGKWRQVAGPPITPRAGEWQRWNVNAAIPLPPPPALGSEEDRRQLTIVAQAAAKRTGEDINEINFWAGQPGSETPGGIWQNVMYKKIQGDLAPQATAADVQYAQIQTVLAQSISDAFMECWKVKYTYWTARPDMRLPGLSTAMNDPAFPSYISGHATISKAAADVLSVIVPKYATTWESDADQARHSRLVAGIHFDIDNQEGYVVGSNVAQQTIAQLQLKQLL